MKKLKTLLVAAGVLLTSLSFNSCLDDDGYSVDNFAMDIVSLKNNGGAPYFRTDDGETLWPAAGYISLDRFQDGQRVALNMTILGDSTTTGDKRFNYYIRVNALDTVFTKSIAKDLGTAQNDSVYGKDPVELKFLRTGNNHLTIRFGANFGGQTKHLVNLVKIDDPNDPYLMEFRHNAFNDPSVTGVEKIMCFNLSDLPSTEGRTDSLTIRIQTFDGLKSYRIGYNSEDK